MVSLCMSDKKDNPYVKGVVTGSMITVTLAGLILGGPDNSRHDLEALREDFLRQIDKAIIEYKIENYSKFREDAIVQWENAVKEFVDVNKNNQVRGQRSANRVELITDQKLRNFTNKAKGQGQNQKQGKQNHKTVPCNGK